MSLGILEMMWRRNKPCIEESGSMKDFIGRLVFVRYEIIKEGAENRSFAFPSVCG